MHSDFCAPTGLCRQPGDLLMPCLSALCTRSPAAHRRRVCRCTGLLSCRAGHPPSRVVSSTTSSPSSFSTTFRGRPLVAAGGRQRLLRSRCHTRPGCANLLLPIAEDVCCCLDAALCSSGRDGALHGCQRRGGVAVDVQEHWMLLARPLRNDISTSGHQLGKSRCWCLCARPNCF